MMMNSVYEGPPRRLAFRLKTSTDLGVRERTIHHQTNLARTFEGGEFRWTAQRRLNQSVSWGGGWPRDCYKVSSGTTSTGGDI